MRFHNEELEKVIAFFGSPYKLAKELGIRPAAIYQWDKVPPQRAYQIEILTNGKFKSSKLLSSNP